MKKKFKISKINVIRAVLAALIIAVMVVIFVLSAQDGNDSGGTSGGVTEFVLRLFGIDAGSMSPEEFTKIEAFVRSAAHFSEYALLAFLSAFMLYTYKLGNLPVLGFAVAFSAVYAVTDEIHQIFVPGRAAQISDWLVDTSGALLGALLMLLILAVYRAVKNRKPQNKKKRNKKRNKKSKA